MTLECFAAVKRNDWTPGPGAYEITPASTTEVGCTYTLKYTIRPKYKPRKQADPDPDFIDRPYSLSRQSYSIGNRYKKKDPEETRGPDFLPDPKELFRKSVSIKNRYADPDTSKTPGPADYFPQKLSGTRVPAQKNRPPIVLDYDICSPGPAAYSPKSHFGEETPRTAIRPKTADLRDNSKSPGYTYNQRTTIGSETPRWTLSKADRLANRLNGVPGPGAYETDVERDTRKLGPTIRPKTAQAKRQIYDPPLENTRRFPESARSQTIGPRSYNSKYDNGVPGPDFLPPSTLNLRPLTIGKKFKEKASAQMPGPGDYSPGAPSERTAPSFSVKGPSVRDDWIPVEKCSPGPAAYNTARPESENSAPKWIIGERSLSSFGAATARERRSMSELRRPRRPETAL